VYDVLCVCGNAAAALQPAWTQRSHGFQALKSKHQYGGQSCCGILQLEHLVFCLKALSSRERESESAHAFNPLGVDKQDVADRHGGLEHMRPRLGPPRLLEAGELCWLTDRTPHEALPLPNDKDRVYRQFFRLVAGPIDVWYARHNTPNPLGLQPEARVSYEDRFAGESEDPDLCAGGSDGAGVVRPAQLPAVPAWVRRVMLALRKAIGLGRQG
jgi:hypothetical protein